MTVPCDLLDHYGPVSPRGILGGFCAAQAAGGPLATSVCRVCGADTAHRRCRQQLSCPGRRSPDQAAAVAPQGSEEGRLQARGVWACLGILPVASSMGSGHTCLRWGRVVTGSVCSSQPCPQIKSRDKGQHRTIAVGGGRTGEPLNHLFSLPCAAAAAETFTRRCCVPAAPCLRPEAQGRC